MENGVDAHAITEHGNMSSYAHAQLWVEGWNKANKNQFKYIPGVEAYFHPDLEMWRRDKIAADNAKIDKKEQKKLLAKQEKLATKLIAKVDADDETEEIEMSNALTIENEDESKSTKHFNPVNRRHHLVVLPKNQEGLLSIFSAVSKSYLHGFYRFPRMDTSVLKEAAKGGNIIVSSACLGGLPSWSIFQELQKIKFDDLSESLLNDPILLEKCITAVGNSYDLMTSTVGIDNFYLELQFNRLSAQNLVNRAILEFAKRNGVTDKLLVTCDAHYPRPELWKERELYKKLGFMNYQSYSPDSLPKSRDDLKCELYPKNATQVWDEYLRSKEGTTFYDDDLIADAIERTHDIAHNVIGEIKPDRSAKFPNEKLVPTGTKSFNHLVKLCKDGLAKRGKDKDQVYIDRLTEELNVIKQMKNADYFISYQKIMELARKVTLCGPGRGSGGGSLINYVLYITDLDPIKWDLPFARFLSVYRKGAPDIDCVHEDHLILMVDGTHKPAGKIVVGDTVLGGDNKPHKITATYSRGLREDEVGLKIVVKADDGTLGWFDVVPKHKFVLTNESIVTADALFPGDRLMSSCGVTVDSISEAPKDGTYVDMTVEDDHRFHIVPFNVIENDAWIHYVRYCSDIIPGTFIMCGEGENYCSDYCKEKGDA